MMEYKGYRARVEFDDEASVLHGRVINTRDVITFQAQSVPELRKEFIDSIEDYLEFCAERGEEPEKPFSGRLVLRMEPDLHRQVATAADGDHKSINSWILDTLQQALHVQHAPHKAAQHESIQQLIHTMVSTPLTFQSTTMFPLLPAHMPAWVDEHSSGNTIYTQLPSISEPQEYTSEDLAGLFDDIQEAYSDAS